MKDCNEIKDNLSFYAEGLLENDVSKKIEIHLKTCENCNIELNEIKNILLLCNDIEEEEVPEDFSEKLHQKLLEISIKKTDSHKKLVIYNKYFRIVAAVAACLVCVVVLGSAINVGLFKNMSEDLINSDTTKNIEAKNNQLNSFGGTADAEISDEKVTKSKQSTSIDSSTANTLGKNEDVTITSSYDTSVTFSEAVEPSAKTKVSGNSELDQIGKLTEKTNDNRQTSTSKNPTTSATSGNINGSSTGTTNKDTSDSFTGATTQGSFDKANGGIFNYSPTNSPNNSFLTAQMQTHKLTLNFKVALSQSHLITEMELIKSNFITLGGTNVSFDTENKLMSVLILFKDKDKFINKLKEMYTTEKSTLNIGKETVNENVNENESIKLFIEFKP